LIFRVQAFAFFAVFFDNRLLEGFRATIAAVVLTATVVVVVVAVAIAFVVCGPTTPFAVGVSLIFRVQAFAFFAVFFDNRLLEGFRATIAAVVLTATVVVVVVAVAIAFVLLGPTTPFAVGVTFIFWV